MGEGDSIKSKCAYKQPQVHYLKWLCHLTPAENSAPLRLIPKSHLTSDVQRFRWIGICLCRVCFKLKASEKHVSRFLDDSLGKCVSTGSCPLPMCLHPHLETSIQQCQSWYTRQNHNLSLLLLPWLVWGAERWLWKGSMYRAEIFLQGMGGCSLVWRKPRLPTDFNFIFNVHGNQSYMPDWIQSLDFWQVFIWAQLGCFSKCPDCSH